MGNPLNTDGILFQTVLQTSAQAVLDECWLFEAQREEELPERVLAKMRANYCDPTVVFVNLDAQGRRIAH
jgi:hypothetical protein